MDEREINCSRKPYFLVETGEKGIFKIPKSVSTEKTNLGHDWKFRYNSQKLILGENIIETPLGDLSIVVERTKLDGGEVMDVIGQTRKLAEVLGYDYVAAKRVGEFTCHHLTGNFYCVYPRLFKAPQSGIMSDSLAKRIWSIDIPKIPERKWNDAIFN